MKIWDNDLHKVIEKAYKEGHILIDPIAPEHELFGVDAFVDEELKQDVKNRDRYRTMAFYTNEENDTKG